MVAGDCAPKTELQIQNRFRGVDYSLSLRTLCSCNKRRRGSVPDDVGSVEPQIKSGELRGPADDKNGAGFIRGFQIIAQRLTTL